MISLIDVPTWHGQQRALKVTLFQLYVHFISKVSMASQKVQAATILHWTIVAIGKASSRLGVLESFLPISLHNLLRAKS